MPIVIVLKTPPISLVAEGEINKTYIRKFSHQLGGYLIEKAPDGRPLLIPTSKDSNIAYVKQITQEQYEEMKEKSARQREMNSRIVRPPLGLKIPRGGHRKN